MTDVTDREWRLIREELLDGPTAMALDEVAAETAADGGPRTVRLYQWLPGALSLGYRQDPATVDWEFCEENMVEVTRRPTGGGGIYHDTHGDIAYSIVAPADELPGDLMETYQLLCEPILDGLRELGVDAQFATEERPALYEPACYLREIDPAHDIVAGDGRKLSGNAQYRRRDAVVQHGSISFEIDPELHLGCFDDPPVTPEEFEARVTSISEQADLSRADFDLDTHDVGPLDSLAAGRDHAVRIIEEALASWCGIEAGEYGIATGSEWTDEELERAEALAEDKYRDEDWVKEGEQP